MRNTDKRLKGIVLLVMIVLITGIGAQIVAAQERITGFSKGLNLGIARVSDDDFGIGLSGRGFLEYAPYIHEIGLRLSGGYFRFQNKVTLGRRPFTSEQEITFESFYATGGAIYRYSRGRIVPFLTANLGVYRYWKEEVSPASGPIIGGIQLSTYDQVETKDGNAFGFNIGGGLEYFMNSKTSMSLEMLIHSVHGEVDEQVYDLTIMFRFLP